MPGGRQVELPGEQGQLTVSAYEWFPHTPPPGTTPGRRPYKYRKASVKTIARSSPFCAYLALAAMACSGPAAAG
jgi:hypothetical protein